MANNLKKRWADALEDAQRKADALGDEEINARLGPATKRFFDATETMEGSLQRLLQGVGGAVLATLGMGLAGWVVGKIVLVHVLPLAAVLALMAALFAFVFWATATARRKGGDIPYLAGLAGFLTCSAAGTGTEESAIMGLVFLAGVGLAQIFVRRAVHETDVGKDSSTPIESPTPLEETDGALSTNTARTSTNGTNPSN